MVQVTVIIVNFNRENLLRKCLASLYSQNPLGVEIIVVDNASSDSSTSMVATEFPQVRLICNSENLGFCAGNNVGIAAAHGEYIALLNNDAVAAPGWLDALVAEMQTGARVGMVASKILVADRPTTIDKVGHGIYWDGQNRGRGSGETDRGQYDHDRDILWPDGCAALYRKAMLDEIGGFDEDFFAYADDAELGLRGRLAGWLARYAPEAIVYHERGATLGKWNPRRIHLIERNRVWLAFLHFPMWLLFLNPFFYMLRLVAGALAGARGEGEAGQVKGFRAKLVLGLTLFAADLEALAGLRKMWPKRRAFRARRRLNDKELFALLRRHHLTLNELSNQLA